MAALSCFITVSIFARLVDVYQKMVRVMIGNDSVKEMRFQVFSCQVLETNISQCSTLSVITEVRRSMVVI